MGDKTIHLDRWTVNSLYTPQITSLANWGSNEQGYVYSIFSSIHRFVILNVSLKLVRSSLMNISVINRIGYFIISLKLRDKVSRLNVFWVKGSIWSSIQCR